MTLVMAQYKVTYSWKLCLKMLIKLVKIIIDDAWCERVASELTVCIYVCMYIVSMPGKNIFYEI